MKRVLLAVFRFYQRAVSPLFPPRCRYIPTCSEYALQAVEKTGNLPVPLHLRNAPTKLMEELGYSDGYKYAHDYPNHFVKQQFMPDELVETHFWQAQGSPQEQKMAEWMKFLWERG